MKPTEFLNELEKVKLWLEEEQKGLEKNYREYIGFYAEVHPEDKFEALNKGYWSTLFFARLADHVSVGARIFPQLSLKEWSIQQNTDGDYSYTICDKLANFIAFNQTEMLLYNSAFDSVSKNWDTTMHLLKPLLKLFRAANEMEFVKEHAFNPDNKPETNKVLKNLPKYLKFWFHYDKSHGHKVLRELIDALDQDRDWLPESMPEGDLGIWETRIRIMLMLRAKIKRIMYSKDITDKYIWAGYLQPHGYDSLDIAFTHYPSSTPSESSIWVASSSFNLYKDDFKETETRQLLSDAARKIDSSFKAYNGKEHYEAALILEKEGKPLEAWNALVSAGYWSGLNRHTEIMEDSWQKAIELCSDQNWEDALDALTYQWEWYQNYKSRQII